MKQNIIKRTLGLLMATVMLFALVIPVSATEPEKTFDCSMAFDAAGPSLTITGTADSTILVLVWDQTILPENFTAAAGPVAFSRFDVNSTTNFTYTIPFSASLARGVYNVKATSNGISKESTFRYVPEAGSETALSEINAANQVSAAAVLEKLNAHKATLLFEDAELTNHGSFISAIFAGRKLAFEKTADLMKAYNNAIAINTIKTAPETDTEKLLKQYSAQLGLDLVKYYDTLSADAKATLLGLLRTDTSYLSADPSVYFPQLSALAAAKNITKWQDLKDIMDTTHKNVIGIDLSTVKNADYVVKEMANYPFSTFADFASNFTKADELVNPPASSNVGGGIIVGGGGGGTPITGSSSKPLAPSKPVEPEKPVTPAPSFSDIPAGHWAKEAIDFLSSNEIINGYPDGSFGPENKITRAEFAKILVGAFKLTSDASLPFADVAAGAWYFGPVQAAYGNSVINGTSDTTFDPDLSITREDACVMIYRILSKEADLKTADANFADADAISDYATEAVNALAASGIIKGMGDNMFEPATSIDRQSAAQLIYNSLKY